MDAMTLIACGVSPSMAKVFADPLSSAFERFGISDPLHIAAFLAQAMHESSRFTALEENLNYRAGGMMTTWPRRFPTLDSTRALMRDRFAPLDLRSRADPIRLANSVYGDRMGNTDPGDGWRYRGRGIFQLTGRAKYASAGAALGLDLIGRPELVAFPETACATAALYWMREENPITCNTAMLIGKPFRNVTQIINGGQNGAEEREALYAECRDALGV